VAAGRAVPAEAAVVSRRLDFLPRIPHNKSVRVERMSNMTTEYIPEPGKAIICPWHGPQLGIACPVCASQPGCDADGYTEGPQGTERYWHCENAAVTEADGYKLCAEHAPEDEPAEMCSWCNRPGADTELGGQPIHAACVAEAEGPLNPEGTE
jgi:hypothetical protein